MRNNLTVSNMMNNPDTVNRVKFGTIDSWIIYNLSNGIHHITDVTNASRTLLMNLKTCDWDSDICKLLKIPMQILPKIKSSSEIYCYITPWNNKNSNNNRINSIRATLPSNIINIPISGCLGDQQSSLFGHLCIKPGIFYQNIIYIR